ncbi:MAG: NAD-dependent epimerase/dehydratase family protein [Bdellovibrionota bacterium]
MDNVTNDIDELKKLEKAKPHILIVGAASTLSGMLCNRLKGRYKITGIDIDNLAEDQSFPGEFHQIGYTKRGVAEIFRSTQFSTLIHLGRIPASDKSRGKRYRENVAGTQNLLQLGLNYNVKNFIIISTHLIYGANRTNHLYIREEEPSNAAKKFIELAGSIELDHEATEFLWQHRSVRTVVLRPTFLVGKHVNHALANALRKPFCPKILGYDPLIQILHESDLIEAILLTIRKKKRGIYNVAGEGVIPFSKAIKLSGATPLPTPAMVLKGTNVCMSFSAGKFHLIY